MMNNPHGQQRMPSRQATFLPSQGMVQGPYTQGPMLMPPYIEYQTRQAGYYYNPTQHMSNQFINYDQANFSHNYNITSPMDTYHQEYPVSGYSNLSVMPAQFMAYDINQDSAGIAQFPVESQFYESSTHHQQNSSAGRSSSDNQNQIDQGYMYDDTFPPEFVPRYNTLPTQDSYELPKPDAPPAKTSLQIQAVSNETDLLPAGLLSPSIKSLTSDTEKSHCKEVTEMSPLELPSLVLDKSNKPLSPVTNLPGYKIKHKMFGQKERQSETNSNTSRATSNPTGNASGSSLQGQKKAQKSDAKNSQKPPPLMDVSVEVPGPSKKSTPKQQKNYPLPPVPHSLGARPKILNKMPPSEVKYTSIEQEEFFSLDAQRYVNN
jgi:hypothetical protein